MYKKRLFSSIFVGTVTALTLCGCMQSVQSGAEALPEEAMVEETAGEAADEKTVDEAAAEENEEEALTTSGEEDEADQSDDIDERYLISDKDDKIVFLDKDGSVRKVVELTGDLSPDYKSDKFIYGVFGNKIIYEMSSEKEEYGSAVYLYDIDEDTWTYVDDAESNTKITLVGDDLYFDFSIYDTQECVSRHYTTFYKYDADGTFDKTENVYDELNSLCTQEDYLSASNYYGNRNNYNISYCLNKFGIVPFFKDNKIALYDEACNCIASYEDSDAEQIEVKRFDGSSVVFTKRDSKAHTVDINVLDVATGETKAIWQCEEDQGKECTVLDMANGKVYFSIEDTTGELNKSTVYAYDVTNDDCNEIIVEEAKAGHRYLVDPIVNAFKVIDDVVYYIAEGEDTTEWYRLDEKDGKKVKTPLDVIMCEYTYGEFGSIKSAAFTHNCPYCNILCAKYYYEWLVLDDSVKNADRINALIDEEAKGRIKDYEEYEPSFSKEDCEEFLHNSSFYSPDSEEVYVSQVRNILGRYLFIGKEGYTYYSGAAHGFPIEDNALYDLDMGEKVWIKDMFPVSENELKEIVASCAKEQFDELKPLLFTDDADDLYNQIYEEIDIEWPFITFYDDYMTFDFQPYDLGPYVSGTISVSVPYTHLR